MLALAVDVTTLTPIAAAMPILAPPESVGAAPASDVSCAFTDGTVVFAVSLFLPALLLARFVCSPIWPSAVLLPSAADFCVGSAPWAPALALALLALPALTKKETAPVA